MALFIFVDLFIVFLFLGKESIFITFGIQILFLAGYVAWRVKKQIKKQKQLGGLTEEELNQMCIEMISDNTLIEMEHPFIIGALSKL